MGFPARRETRDPDCRRRAAAQAAIDAEERQLVAGAVQGRDDVELGNRGDVRYTAVSVLDIVVIAPTMTSVSFQRDQDRDKSSQKTRSDPRSLGPTTPIHNGELAAAARDFRSCSAVGRAVGESSTSWPASVRLNGT
jgi:hypothetical protein